MKTLVTGATGLIGNAIARKLLEEGHEVRALVRAPARAEKLLPAKVERVGSDILDPANLARAPAGGLDAPRALRRSAGRFPLASKYAK